MLVVPNHRRLMEDMNSQDVSLILFKIRGQKMCLLAHSQLDILIVFVISLLGCSPRLLNVCYRPVNHCLAKADSAFGVHLDLVSMPVCECLRVLLSPIVGLRTRILSYAKTPRFHQMSLFSDVPVAADAFRTRMLAGSCPRRPCRRRPFAFPPFYRPPRWPRARFTVALPLARPTPRPRVPRDLNIGAFLPDKVSIDIILWGCPLLAHACSHT